jgi:LacI family transcriptional regulator
MLHDQKPELEKVLIERLNAYHVDGIILSSVSRDEEYIQYIREMGTPVVTIDNRLSEEIPFVGINNQEALYQLTRKAIRKGYQRIVFVCPPLGNTDVNRYAHEQRYEGFCKALSENPEIEKAVVSDVDYFSRCKELLLEQKKTAYLCSGDIFALDLMKYFGRQGKKASKDYGIAGFDSIDILDYVSPQLDTVDNNSELVAKRAVEILMALINKETVEKEIILDAAYRKGETL